MERPFSGQPKLNTANKNVHILDTAFFIPQLSRYRRIWIYLPASYNVSREKYPVLYMHDGQNVFDNATSFSGEWGVDEAMDTLGKIREAIVGQLITAMINVRMNIRLTTWSVLEKVKAINMLIF
ncbi:MAG: alpha/beta hydrolase-fold protein [Chitinophagaceae bacterium]